MLKRNQQGVIGLLILVIIVAIFVVFVVQRAFDASDDETQTTSEIS